MSRLYATVLFFLKENVAGSGRGSERAWPGVGVALGIPGGRGGSS